MRTKKETFPATNITAPSTKILKTTRRVKLFLLSPIVLGLVQEEPFPVPDSPNTDPGIRTSNFGIRELLVLHKHFDPRKLALPPERTPPTHSVPHHPVPVPPSARNNAFGGTQANGVPMSQPFEQPQKLYSLSGPAFLNLPPELILMILLDVVKEEGEISWQERTRVQLICRTLHSYVNLTPAFWSQLSVSEPKELWQEHLKKSRQHELAVACDCPSDQELHASFLSTILPHAHRIFSLTSSVDYDSPQLLIEIATRAAPTLRILRLFCEVARIVGIPFGDMPRLQTMELLGEVEKPDWWEATGLRVLKIEETQWVGDISAFLDFLEENNQLESFYYSLEENVYSPEGLRPRSLPASRDMIVLPKLAHFTAYSIPAFHLQTILQHVAFPPHSYISATVADSFPPQEPVDFIVPVMNHLVALRPPSSLALLFNSEEGYITATEQRWNLGFYNEALDLEPREEAYRTFLQQIPPEIRALISSVNAVELPLTDAQLLVEALLRDAPQIVEFECSLEATWLAALWTDESRGWAGFRLPRLQSITFNVCRNSTAACIRTIRDLLHARSVAVRGGLHRLDTSIVVPAQYDKGEIQVALEDPGLLNLGPRIELVAADEAESDGTFDEFEEDTSSDSENVGADDSESGGAML